MSEQHSSTGSETSVGRRDIGRLIRDVALGSYGVASVSGSHWYDRLLGLLRLTVPGVRIDGDGRLRVEVHLQLVPGVPAQAVVSNVEESVRYIVGREMGLTIDELVIVVDGQPINAAAGGSHRPQG